MGLISCGISFNDSFAGGHMPVEHLSTVLYTVFEYCVGVELVRYGIHCTV